MKAVLFFRCFLAQQWGPTTSSRGMFVWLWNKSEGVSPCDWRKVGSLFVWWYCWWFRTPAPVEVGSLSHYLQGFIHPWWLFGISSINSISVFQFSYHMKSYENIQLPSNHGLFFSCTSHHFHTWLLLLTSEVWQFATHVHSTLERWNNNYTQT